MKKTILLLLAVICLTASQAFAKDAKLAEVVAALEAGYSGLKDLQAAFTQITTVAGMPKPQKGNGELMLRRPPGTTAQFRFDYTVPKQSILSNGKHVWFYQPENRQVFVSSTDEMFKGGNSIALAYLTGLGNVSKDFSASLSKEPRDKNGNYQLDLVPRTPTPALSKLRLAIDQAAVEKFKTEGNLADTFPIVSSVVIDASGNETRISYSKIKVNKGLGAGRFTFRVPEGVEVIKP